MNALIVSREHETEVVHMCDKHLKEYLSKHPLRPWEGERVEPCDPKISCECCAYMRGFHLEDL